MDFTVTGGTLTAEGTDLLLTGSGRAALASAPVGWRADGTEMAINTTIVDPNTLRLTWGTLDPASYPIVIDPGWERETKEYRKRGSWWQRRFEKMRVRGYGMEPCIRTGTTCTAGPEMTAQAHAIRRMAHKHGKSMGSSAWVLPRSLDWEVAPKNQYSERVEDGWDPDPCLELNVDKSRARWRADIVRDTDGGWGGQHEVIEAKTVLLFQQAYDEAVCYARLFDTQLDIRSEPDDTLSREGWRVRIPYGPTFLEAWSPARGVVLYARDNNPDEKRRREQDHYVAESRRSGKEPVITEEEYEATTTPSVPVIVCRVACTAVV